MRDITLRLGVKLQNTMERVEKNEGTIEHGGLELAYEWPHLSEQLPHMVAAVLGS